MAALAAVTLAGGIAAAAVAAWQVSVAAERIRGHARHLAAAVAAEGYGLHHWLHGARTGGTLTAVPAEGTARALTAAERADLADHSATAAWRRAAADPTRPVLPRGWEIVQLVGTAGGLPDGVVALRPSGGVVAGPAWDALRRALDLTPGPSGAGADALAAAALADWDPARDRALPASRFARLDTGAVLRQVHAGHPAPVMGAELLMGGNGVGGVVALATARAGLPEITGACPGAAAGTLCADTLDLRAGLDARAGVALATAAVRDLSIPGDVNGIAWVRTRDATVSGTVTAPALTACADAEADLCGGGRLDLEGGTGTPSWATAAIFGDTVIRDGSRLTGISDVTAATGVLGALRGALTVRGCLRVTAPFIHGAGC